MRIHGNSPQLPHWHGKRATCEHKKDRGKTGGDATGSNNRNMKSAEDGIIVERGTPQLNVQELGQEQQLMLLEHETQEASSEHEGETQGAFSNVEEETQEALSEVEEET